jgi:uracil-DNA glycosylase
MTQIAARCAGGVEPDRDCPLCPRLVAFRESWRAKEPGWFNAPVKSFGPSDARLAVVGLAPGVRGANRTGRPFTGDFAGELLYATLIEHGFAEGRYEARPDDGLTLTDCRIVNAVRCVPPGNKPTPGEIAQCRRFLAGALADMPNLRAIVVLGRIAHDSVLSACGRRASAARFAHGAQHAIAALPAVRSSRNADRAEGAEAWPSHPAQVRLFDSYHCSRLNTNTGVLTPAMFRDVFAAVRSHLG